MTALLTHRDYYVYDPILELWEIIDRLDTLAEYTGDAPRATQEAFTQARNDLASLIGPVSRQYDPSEQKEAPR